MRLLNRGLRIRLAIFEFFLATVSIATLIAGLAICIWSVSLWFK